MQLKNHKLVDNPKVLEKLCAGYTTTEKKIIMTNGCFDIIHSGHVHILSEAKKMGDVLIVAMNSDESVVKNKGNNRPINNEIERAFVLSSLTMVDHIIIFNDTTPESLICTILPDVLVKGADYENKKIAGRDCLEKNGKKVALVSLLEGKSTSKIIQKLDDI